MLDDHDSPTDSHTPRADEPSISTSEETQTSIRGSDMTTEYCAELQRWMWRYYCGLATRQSWAASPFPPPGTSLHSPGCSYSYASSLPASSSSSRPAGAQTPAADARPAQQQQHGTQPQAGKMHFSLQVGVD